MSEPTLFGIEHAQWENVSAVATALSAIASFAAVWVALHLARQVARQKVSFTVGHRVLVGQGAAAPFPEYLVYQIVNKGERNVRVDQIGWRVGLFTRRFAIQTFEPSLSSSLPVELSHGQSATYFVPLGARKEPWLPYFAKGMLMPYRRTSLATLRGTMFTSIGNQFHAKPEEGLKKKLNEACLLIERDSSNP